MEELNIIHEKFLIALDDFENKYINNKINNNDDPAYKRCLNILNDVDRDLFSLKNDAELENEELKRQIIHYNKQAVKEKQHNEELLQKSNELENSHLGAEKLLKDKENIYFYSVLSTINLVVVIIVLGYYIYKKQ